MTPEQIALQVQIQSSFQPSAPIDKAAMFSGRLEQIQRILTATLQKGQHVILYGERGVGKTSLARTIHEIISSAGVRVPKSPSINCDKSDSFSSLWHKVFSEIEQTIIRPPTIGFEPTPQTQTISLRSLLPDVVTPNDVRVGLSALGREALIIIDEIDRLVDMETRSLLADTVKSLSDNAVNVTLILVGVAESVSDLIAEHQSIDRALVQIHMPRMSEQELLDIISRGESRGAMRFSDPAKRLIVGLSQGLPHYTHLLCLEASLRALSKGAPEVFEDSVRAAIKTIVTNKSSVSASYETATCSQYKDNLHEKVLVACARAKTDSEGFFMSPEVASQLSEIVGKECAVSKFQRHLNQFCTEARGSILWKKGEERRFRYRFSDPLMQPYVLLKGVDRNLLQTQQIMIQTYLPLEFQP